jgi:hypothetical protein
MANNYTPKIGDSIRARRKVKSDIYDNSIVGPVVETWTNACRVRTNEGTKIESEFQLFYNDWNFTFLFRTEKNE